MDLSKFLEKADLALRKRNAPQAIALYRQVLVASPGHGAARAGLLAAFRRQAELKGGASFLDRAAAKTTRAAVAGLASAKQHAALVKTCEAGLEKDPNDGYLAAHLAAALEALERPEEALATWQHRLEIDADDLAALKAAGKLHYRLRQIAEAVQCLDHVHRIDPHDAEVEKLRKHLAAEGTLASTRYESARSSRELAKDAGSQRQVERSQRMHRDAGELQDDLAALAQRLQARPDDLDVRRQLIRARLRAGEATAAAQCAREGLSQRPGDESLRDLLGEAELAEVRARLQAARAAPGGSAPGAPGGPAARPGGERAAAPDVAQLEAECSRLERAELARRVRQHPGEPELRLALGRAELQAGAVDAAVEHFQALVADPRVEVDARLGLGQSFLAKGLLPLARRQFEAALARVGGLQAGDRAKDICYHLALVCEQQGERQLALDRYLELYEVDIHYKDVARKVDELS